MAHCRGLLRRWPSRCWKMKSQPGSTLEPSSLCLVTPVSMTAMRHGHAPACGLLPSRRNVHAGRGLVQVPPGLVLGGVDRGAVHPAVGDDDLEPVEGFIVEYKPPGATGAQPHLCARLLLSECRPLLDDGGGERKHANAAVRWAIRPPRLRTPIHSEADRAVRTQFQKWVTCPSKGKERPSFEERSGCSVDLRFRTAPCPESDCVSVDPAFRMFRDTERRLVSGVSPPGSQDRAVTAWNLPSLGWPARARACGTSRACRFPAVPSRTASRAAFQRSAGRAPRCASTPGARPHARAPMPAESPGEAVEIPLVCVADDVIVLLRCGDERG